MAKRINKATRDIEKGYTTKQMVAKLRTLADCLESGKQFKIQIAGEKISVPASIPDKFGPVTCPICMASFLIDARGECIFVNLEKPRIPLDGVYCPKCGLIQGHENESCYLCAEPLDITVH